LISVSNFWYIITHKDHPEEAAEEWRKNGVCAFGTRRFLSDETDFEVNHFKEIKKGDVVFAYVKNYNVSYVGTVLSNELKYNTKNSVGNSKNGYGYVNQKFVEWWDKPHHFNTKELPNWMAEQFGKRHRTISPILYSKYSFDEIVDKIKSILSGTGLDFLDEKFLQAGIRKFLRRKIDFLELGLSIVDYEKRISDSNQPDFIAKDKDGVTVIIECKKTAEKSDVEKLLSYSNDISEKHRMILIAFSITPECRVEAKRNLIDCFECDLKFNKL